MLRFSSLGLRPHMLGMRRRGRFGTGRSLGAHARGRLRLFQRLLVIRSRVQALIERVRALTGQRLARVSITLYDHPGFLRRWKAILLNEVATRSLLFLRAGVLVG